MNSILIEAPTVELIPLDLAKDYLRVTHDFEDTVILRLIKSVIRRCEKRARMTFGRQTWETMFDVPRARRDCLMPRNASLNDADGIYRNLTLPKKPLNSIVSVGSINTADGVTATFNDTYYTLLGGKLFWKSNFWGDVGTATNIIVRYTTGAATEEEFKSKFPDLVEAILLTLDHAYNTRGEAVFPRDAAGILASYWSSSTYDNE